MPSPELTFNEKQALSRLLHFLSVEGITGEEEAIGRAVLKELLAVGLPRKQVLFDDAHKRIPLPTQTGNLIVHLPGTVPGPRRLFMTHLDTVPLCAGAKPVRKGERIVPAGPTALGADDRVGVACLVTLIATLLERGWPHPPLTLLFTVREESGLWGARYVDLARLKNPAMAFNIDGPSPRDLTIGAVGADRWQVEIFGKASHAGVHPERGISATMVASLAMAEIHKGGWFGKVRQDGKEGTANVGVFGDQAGGSAGRATNVVTDYVCLHGESRSHDASFIGAITAAYRQAFRQASQQVCNDRGRCAKIKFHSRRDYHPFRLKTDCPVVRLASAAASRAGWPAELRTTNGGLDANWMVRHGVPTITFGAGQYHPHTIDEFVEIADFLDGCRFALALATQE